MFLLSDTYDTRVLLYRVCSQNVRFLMDIIICAHGIMYMITNDNKGGGGGGVLVGLCLYLGMIGLLPHDV